jgi:RNase P subunit RPR2
MKKEIISDWSKDWKGKYCYKCKSDKNLENLTRSAWWVFYYRCNTCNSIYYLNYGDKMGGQADCLSSANIDDVNKDLLEHPEWYKI